MCLTAWSWHSENDTVHVCFSSSLFARILSIIARYAPPLGIKAFCRSRPAFELSILQSSLLKLLNFYSVFTPIFWKIIPGSLCHTKETAPIVQFIAQSSYFLDALDTLTLQSDTASTHKAGTRPVNQSWILDALLTFTCFGRKHYRMRCFSKTQL